MASSQTCVLSVLSQRLGLTVAQQAVDDKSNEIPAAKERLAGLLLEGRVITMDALLTQRAFAQQIVDQHGYYLMIVKANQPQLRDDLALFFELPAIVADQERWDRACTITRAHGRLETRTLECTTGDCTWLGWPGAGSLPRCPRV